MSSLKFVHVWTSPTRSAFIRIDDLKGFKEIETKAPAADAPTKSLQIATHEMGQITAVNESVDSFLRKLDAASGARVLVITADETGNTTDYRK